MNFTDTLWQSITPVYEEILAHPFIIELSEGRLSHNIFAHYLEQDALYLADFARALAFTAIKAEDQQDFLTCIDFAKGAVTAEISLHQELFKQFNIEPKTKKSLSCLAYTQFLLASTQQGSFAEAMAACLPCFWIYREVGRHIQLLTHAQTPYATWIDTYSGAEFDASVDRAIALTNKAALHASDATLKKMQNLFHKSSQLEWAFWEGAYRLEKLL